MTELSDEELLAELGVDIEAASTGGHTPREERIIAGFEEILRFYARHQRLPQHGETGDIFERLYAVRLDRLRVLPEARELLAGMDMHGFLSPLSDLANGEALDDAALLAALELDSMETANQDNKNNKDDITVLRHVRPYEERRAAEEIAHRATCKDFARFEPRFRQAEDDLKTGLRQARPFGRDAKIEGDSLKKY
jgi:hypothetical protein